MEVRVYGNLNAEGLEVVQRHDRSFVRYDAGAHQIAWREDELTSEEFARLRATRGAESSVIIALQRRISASGDDPYVQNWSPAN